MKRPCLRQIACDCSVAEPYNAAFDPYGSNEFALFIDAMFWADIILNFWTGFVSDPFRRLIDPSSHPPSAAPV